MKRFGLQDVVDTYTLTKDLFDERFGTTLPALDHQRMRKIGGIIESVFMNFGGNVLYPGTIKKAAVLFYKIIKNHVLVDGNKRMAVIVLNAFFFSRGKEVSLDYITMYKLAISVAQSDARDQKRVIKSLETTFRNSFSTTKKNLR